MATNEERISALEKKLAEVEATYIEARDLMLFLGGSERVFQAVTLAMIAAFPNKDAVRPLLARLTEQASTSVLFGSQSEIHLQGAQAAHKLILEHLEMKDSLYFTAITSDSSLHQTGEQPPAGEFERWASRS